MSPNAEAAACPLAGAGQPVGVGQAALDERQPRLAHGRGRGVGRRGGELAVGGRGARVVPELQLRVAEHGERAGVGRTLRDQRPGGLLGRRELVGRVVDAGGQGPSRPVRGRQAHGPVGGGRGLEVRLHVAGQPPPLEVHLAQEGQAGDRRRRLRLALVHADQAVELVAVDLGGQLEGVRGLAGAVIAGRARAAGGGTDQVATTDDDGGGDGQCDESRLHHVLLWEKGRVGGLQRSVRRSPPRWLPVG